MRNSGDFNEAAGESQQPPLTDSQKQILEFGRKEWSSPAHRENDIRSTFDMSSSSYFQKLHSLLSHPEAVAYAPDVVRRMNSIMDKRSKWRRWDRG